MWQMKAQKLMILSEEKEKQSRDRLSRHTDTWELRNVKAAQRRDGEGVAKEGGEVREGSVHMSKEEF